MKYFVTSLAALALVASTAVAQDGINVGGTLLATQDSPTQFGNATGGGQNSAGGSELNQLFGSISGGTLNLGLTGNLEGNFNKLFIFFDAVGGGENVLMNDNNDGGFNEINNLAGLTFEAGFSPDHGIRVEVGDGFFGIRGFDLIDNTGGDIWTGGGPGNLPLASGLGGFGTISGWDNSNTAGVSDSDASTAATATKGWEFSIDMATFFGATPGSVKVMAIVTSGDATFLSNQVLPGIGGGGNLGGPSGVNFNNVPGLQCATIVPEPATMAILGLGGILVLRRRR